MGQLKVLVVAKIPGVDADLIDSEGLVAKRYEMQPGSVLLVRPDQHVCARGSLSDPGWLQAALQRALAVH